MSDLASAPPSTGWLFVYRSSHALQSFRSPCFIFNFKACCCIMTRRITAFADVPCANLSIYEQHLHLTDLSVAVKGWRDHTVHLPRSQRFYVCSHRAWVIQAAAQLETASQRETHPDALLTPVGRPRHAHRSLAVHVFTSKAIAPDLYDGPLTLSVLVHQHQAEKTPKGVREQKQMWLSVIQRPQPPTGIRRNKSHPDFRIVS